MSDHPEQVELERAWLWRCPACSATNYAESTTLDPETTEQILRDELGLQEWETVPEDMACELGTAPLKVQCTGCARWFATANEDVESMLSDDHDLPESGH